jgi:hypothetical protein
MASISYDYYSVDASIMIKLKDMLPADVFKPAWDEIERLVDEGRWKIFEVVAEEMHGDNLKGWISNHSNAIVNFNPTLNDYLTRLMAELQHNNMTIVNPMSLKNNGDPLL